MSRSKPAKPAFPLLTLRQTMYYPVPAHGYDTPAVSLTLLLQGAFVDTADYTDFARAVASHGSVVVVPNP